MKRQIIHKEVNRFLQISWSPKQYFQGLKEYNYHSRILSQSNYHSRVRTENRDFRHAKSRVPLPQTSPERSMARVRKQSWEWLHQMTKQDRNSTGCGDGGVTWMTEPVEMEEVMGMGKWRSR